MVTTITTTHYFFMWNTKIYDNDAFKSKIQDLSTKIELGLFKDLHLLRY